MQSPAFSYWRQAWSPENAWSSALTDREKKRRRLPWSALYYDTLRVNEQQLQREAAELKSAESRRKPQKNLQTQKRRQILLRKGLQREAAELKSADSRKKPQKNLQTQKRRQILLRKGLQREAAELKSADSRKKPQKNLQTQKRRQILLKSGLRREAAELKMEDLGC